MANVIYSSKAAADLDNIWYYTIDKWSDQQAENYYTGIVECCEYLAGTPNKGKSYSDIQSNVLGFSINKHIIFYRIIRHDEIEVVRILHSSMDLKNRIIE